MTVTIAEGQRSDAVLAKPVLEQAKKIMGRIDEVLGDKEFDSDEIREACLNDLDALPVIPNIKNRKKPWPWDETMKETYKQRNKVERSYGKAKQFRRFASSYGELGEMFLGFVWLVFGFIHIIQIANSVNTL